MSGSSSIARRAIGIDSGYYIANARTGRPDPDRTPDMTNKETAPGRRSVGTTGYLAWH